MIRVAQGRIMWGNRWLANRGAAFPTRAQISVQEIDLLQYSRCRGDRLATLVLTDVLNVRGQIPLTPAPLPKRSAQGEGFRVRAAHSKRARQSGPGAVVIG